MVRWGLFLRFELVFDEVDGLLAFPKICAV